MYEWRKCKNRDGIESRYAQTNGIYTVSAARVKDQWRYTLWKGTGQPEDQWIAVFNSGEEARLSAYDYQ